MSLSTRTSTFAGRYVQRGLSLIELMISITIGLIILAAMATLFSSQSRTRSELDKSNRMIDNGRYSLEILSDNLRMAGFYGNFRPSGAPTATPDPCDLTAITNPAANLDVLLHHVQGYNAVAATSQITSLPAACGFTYTAGSATTLKPGSDILLLRRASTSSPVAAAAAVAASIYLQVSNCSTDTASYQIAPGSATFTAFREKDCTTSASLRPFMVQAYFVSPDNNAGDGIPTLKRRELDPASGAFVTTPLVEGIEYMQVDYGLDDDTDGAADSYIAAPTTANWPDIVSVKINMIARNIEPTAGYTDTKTYVLGSAGAFGPFGDTYKRHAYTQVVRLVNPSSRREIP
ncbi:MAG: prepilin-type N-terminal cleavage/methylation domain-containing protein [Gallionella sp.]|nr:MAG: prepilin-type N-terminal cleavage/methylation domain-containing protein [Gallionella sp.]